MKKLVILCGGALGLALLLSGCPGGGGEQAGGKSSGDVVARVGDDVITLPQFEELLNSQNRLIRNRYSTLEQKKKLLDSLVERMAMVQEAKRLGLERDREVIDGLNRILARQVVNKLFNEKLAKEIVVSDEEIGKYYQENGERYHSPEKVRAHSIFFKGPRANAKEHQAARARAQKVMQELKNKPDQRLFIDKARTVNEDEESKKVAGDTGFKTREEMEQKYGKAFAEAAFSLQQPNEMAGPVEEDGGFYLLRQSGRQAAIDLPLEKVKEQIRTTLLARKRGEAYQKFIEETRQKAKIEIFDEVLAKAKLDLSQDVPVPPGHVPPGAQPVQLKRLEAPPKPGNPPALPQPPQQP